MSEKQKIKTKLDFYHCLIRPEEYEDENCGLRFPGEQSKGGNMSTDKMTMEQAREKLIAELRAAGTYHTLEPEEIDALLLSMDEFAEHIVGVTDCQRRAARAKAKIELLAELKERLPILNI